MPLEDATLQTFSLCTAEFFFIIKKVCYIAMIYIEKFLPLEDALVLRLAHVVHAHLYTYGFIFIFFLSCALRTSYTPTYISTYIYTHTQRHTHTHRYTHTHLSLSIYTISIYLSISLSIYLSIYLYITHRAFVQANRQPISNPKP